VTRSLIVACCLAATHAAAAELRMQAVRPAELSALDLRINAMLTGGRLRAVYVRDDALIAGRRHERLDQYHQGVKVWGGQVTRQTDERGSVSIFGQLQEDIPDLDVRPGLTADEARAAASRLAAVEIGPLVEPELLVFTRGGGAFALAWRVPAFDGEHLWALFLDAQTGRELYRYDDLQRQTAQAAIGTGVLGDRKKMSVTETGGTFYAADGLRPPSIVTYDAKGDTTLATRLINGVIRPGLTETASSANDDWTDGPTVDAHTYAGWVYDYYFHVHNRRGLDGADLTMRSVVNPARRSDYDRLRNAFPSFFLNAFWSTGTKTMTYGVGAPVSVGGQMWNHLAGSLDVVAHELTHGVTQFSSNLLYFDEPGALNEAFSDLMSMAVQSYYKSASANYLVGDDVVTPGGIRSMVTPFAYGDPDHYSVRYTGLLDGGGVHTNSLIITHAYYLAVEGGTNRVSRLRVEGVGAAQREKIEKAFFRAFTRILTPAARFSDARAATIQSARDLYGANDPTVRALTQAWDAVGVN
jgi:Zn-dependent metalloprotease